VLALPFGLQSVSFFDGQEFLSNHLHDQLNRTHNRKPGVDLSRLNDCAPVVDGQCVSMHTRE